MFCEHGQVWVHKFCAKRPEVMDGSSVLKCLVCQKCTNSVVSTQIARAGSVDPGGASAAAIMASNSTNVRNLKTGSILTATSTMPNQGFMLNSQYITGNFSPNAKLHAFNNKPK